MAASYAHLFTGASVRGQYRNVMLVVVDGLRPDAVVPEHMPVLSGLLRLGWQAARATTVRPSVTVAALTSLATGVLPDRHGLTEQGLPSPARLRGLRPLPGELRRLGVTTTVVMPNLPGAARWLAASLLRLGGVGRVCHSPPAPGIVLDLAMRRLEGNRLREFVVVYLNDLDLAGHAWGWMSPAYLQAARHVDRAMGRLNRYTEQAETLIIVTADHGGGGVLHQDHDHPHPLNDGIPLGMLGGRVMPGLVSPEPARLIDIPPTVLHCFGGLAPTGYAGRVLHEAFVSELVWA